MKCPNLKFSQICHSLSHSIISLCWEAFPVFDLKKSCLSFIDSVKHLLQLHSERKTLRNGHAFLHAPMVMIKGTVIWTKGLFLLCISVLSDWTWSTMNSIKASLSFVSWHLDRMDLIGCNISDKTHEVLWAGWR